MESSNWTKCTVVRSSKIVWIYAVAWWLVCVVFFWFALQFDREVVWFFWLMAPLSLIVGAYCIYLAMFSQWVVKCHDDHIEVRNSWRPWRRAKIKYDDILNASSNWEGYGSDSHCDVVLRLTADAALAVALSGACRRVKGEVAYLDMSIAADTPSKLVNLILSRGHLSIEYEVPKRMRDATDS